MVARPPLLTPGAKALVATAGSSFVAALIVGLTLGYLMGVGNAPPAAWFVIGALAGATASIAALLTLKRISV